MSDAWEFLLDDKHINKRRAESEKQFGDLGDDQIKYLRKRAKNDLYFLCHGILGYDLMSPKLHGSLANWMLKTQGERYRMILKPRGHYKTSMATIGDGIRIVLPNDAGVVEHPYCLGTNAKVLLGHEVRDSASRFLFEITQAFVSNPLMMALFPECIPSNRKQRMNRYELELPREASSQKEPTFDTIGAGGAAQGRHYNWLKLDDIVGEDARDSDTVMGRVINWFDNVNSLLTRLAIDGFDLIGTRWSFSDVYQHALKKYGINRELSIMNAYDDRELDKFEEGKLVAYVRGAIENGVPIFPEEFSLEDLELIRRNRQVWAAQYANNPKDAGMTEFDEAWLRYYNVSGQNLVIFGGEEEGSWKVNIWELDRVILVDPSMGEDRRSDESAIVVCGVDDKFNIFVLETIKKRFRPPDLVDLIFDLNHKWAPRLFSFEEVAFSAVYKYWIDEKTNEMGSTPIIVPFKPRAGSNSKKNKKGRIRSLTHYFAAGQVFIMRGMHEFLDEYEWFPMITSDHLLDALAQGPEVWSKAEGESDVASRQKAEEMILESRSPITGY